MEHKEVENQLRHIQLLLDTIAKTEDWGMSLEQAKYYEELLEQIAESVEELRTSVVVAHVVIQDDEERRKE